MTRADQPAPVYLAADTTDSETAHTWAKAVEGHLAGIKLGLEFYLSAGAAGYSRVAEAGLPIFLDLKLHDIPNTVAGGIKAIAPLKPAFLTLHGLGGYDMLARASEAAARYCPETKLLAVTVLTSMDDDDLTRIGVPASPLEAVLQLGEMAVEAGVHGLVCSPFEVAALRSQLGSAPFLMVPGVRPEGSSKGDQKRVMTPLEAVTAGASALVIGRPITQAPNPAEAAASIQASLR